jgi:UDP-N-acetylglucosamine 2-epimerase (non-hydrolysing)
MTDLLVAVGARPNFMKAASVVEAARGVSLDCALVHTGQHYDDELSRVFFEELELPPADVNLGVGSGTHAAQTAQVMLAFERELLRIDPAIVVVVGDVNSTLACALVATKERYPVAHVEAGLRSFDQLMPEEINRRLCDHVSTFLFTTSRDADENLAAEGIPSERVSFVGNTMIDTLLRFEQIARDRKLAEDLGVAGRQFVALTVHRPETVDEPERLAQLIDAVIELAAHVPVVFPVHPRTRERLESFGLADRLRAEPELIVSPPLGYLDFVSLIADAGLVVTDSGGVQEETTVLGIPCLTVRERTERPVTVTEGTNVVVGLDARRMLDEAVAALGRARGPRRIPELWDGKAGERIAARLAAAVPHALEDRVGA